LKKTVLAVGTVAVFGLGVGVPLAVSTIGAEAESSKPQDSLVDKIATKFNLNKDEVKKVFDEERGNRQADREEHFKERLNSLVADNKLTQDQANQIEAKHNEVTQLRDQLKDKTKEERKAALDQKRDEIKQWAKDNGIDEQLIVFGVGRNGGPGPMRGNQ
jgi:polyhydroxyalkanoate synthesis regulator phasin